VFPFVVTCCRFTFENDDVNANDAVVANEADVANDADVAILAVNAFCTLLTVRLNVLPLPLVYVVVAFDIDAVTNAFGVNDAVFANEAVFGTNVDKLTLKLLPSPLIKFKLGLLNDKRSSI